VGSYEQVAERIAAFHAAGIETLLTQFQPFEPEMRRFAQHVMPRVCALREGLQAHTHVQAAQ
jgi:alkanesulfonate monooxygenase